MYIFWSIVCFVVSLIVLYIWGNIEYRKTDYGKSHKEGLWKILIDDGALGEYKTSRQFEDVKFNHKIIYNCYIPKYNGETTEIDIIAITENGVWVIENKNYNGWIFGDAYSKKWCQTLHKNKFFFYNPIWQNKNHIKYLTTVLNTIPESYFKSIIVFNRAEIKKVSLPDNSTYVFDINQFKNFLKEPHLNLLSPEQINSIYEKLLPYTVVSKEQKNAHIDNINRRYK